MKSAYSLTAKRCKFCVSDQVNFGYHFNDCAQSDRLNSFFCLCKLCYCYSCLLGKGIYGIPNV